jgi:chemotaxis protein methyltransferase CheR
VENEHRYEVKSEFKTSIVFRRLNLAEPPYPMHGPLDVIFCRNVMIYFDDQVRRRLLANMFDILKPGGYLMVGHAESLTGMVSKFKTVVPSIYVKA